MHIMQIHMQISVYRDKLLLYKLEITEVFL